MLHTLAIDVGGSGLKAAVLDGSGEMLTERLKVETPVGARPAEFVATLLELIAPLPAFDRIAVDFPGVVRNGFVRTAANLGNAEWIGFPLAKELEDRLQKPVRLANDADVQGLAVIEGKGVEVVITLGTGFGSAVYENGRLGPHLELAHHPFRKGETYEQQLGNETRREVGTQKWEKRVHRAIECLRVLTYFDRLYIGGGNSKKLTEELPAGVTVVDNIAGIRGGVHLFDD